MIDPVAIANDYGNDVLRYFLAREIPFGADGDFSFTRLEERYTADLAKGLGNFVSRVTAMAAKEYDAKTPAACDDEVANALQSAWNDWTRAMEEYCPEDALAALWQLISFGDKYIEVHKPWALSKEDKNRYTTVIRSLLEIVRHVSVILQPFMPGTTEKILHSLGIEEVQQPLSLEESQVVGAITIATISKSPNLFPSREEKAQ